MDSMLVHVPLFEDYDVDITLGRGGHVRSMIINNERFEVPRYTVQEPLTRMDGIILEHEAQCEPWAKLRTLDECYQRPSAAKQSIYRDWCNWAERCGAVAYGVSSYNAQCFTFMALLADSCGDYYALVSVTRDNARVRPFLSPIFPQ